ncbi:MAG TPA: hypothetical protein VH595_22730 [Verrucomicrobiae bacterium]|nr:hypothetical protein [Verrucomicrobiae bacterium]
MDESSNSSMVQVWSVSFAPTAGVHPSAEWTLQKLYAATNRLIAAL